MESFDLLSSLTSILIKISISYILLGLFTLITVEAINSRLQLRSKFLYNSLKKSFNDDQMLTCIYNHPLIKILGENQSYIDRNIFSHALIDCLGITDPKEFIRLATQPTSKYAKNNFVQGLCVLSRSASTVEEVRQKASFLFNDFVHKISNGYKTKVQNVIVVVATFLTVIMNIDSVKIFNAISTNALMHNVLETLKDNKSVSDNAKDVLYNLIPNAFPIGWKSFNIANYDFYSLLSMFAGWIITIIFTSFAAQFLYSRFIVVKKPEIEKNKNDT